VTPGQLRRQRRVEPDRLLFPLAMASWCMPMRIR